MASTRAWWLHHALLPALLCAALAAAIHFGGWDRALADALYDPATGWPLEPRTTLSRALYVGEVWLVRAIAVLALALLLLARGWRRPASYFVLCLGLTTGLVSIGKSTTNMDCPRQLLDYGGKRPFVGLLEERPDAWPAGRCFPAGHASGGYSMIALYFLLGERRRAWRWAGLAASLGLGFTMSATQWARGMHFPSHDLVSVALAWTIALAAYTAIYRRHLWNPEHAPAAD